MDRTLEERYKFFFEKYQVQDDEILFYVRDIISEYLLFEPEKLRPDAAHFLLINFDQMIIKPYFSAMSNIDKPRGFQEMSKEIFMDRIQLAIRIIIRGLTNRRESSSHDVLKSILKNWDSLSELFGWG